MKSSCPLHGRITALLLAVTAAVAITGCGLLAGKSLSPGPGKGEVYVSPNPPVPAGTAGKKVTITLYFPDFQAQHVIPEERQLDLEGHSLEETVMAELLKGPQDPYLHRGIPEGITVRQVSLDQGSGVVSIDFDSNVVERFPQGSAGQMMFMQSLLRTLTELPGASSVQILLQGEKLEILGDLEVSEPGRLPAGIATYPVFIDPDRSRWLQQEVNQGRQTWRRHPLEAARNEGRMAGFSRDDKFTLASQTGKGEYSGTGMAEVEAVHEGKNYIIQLIQPVTIGQNGIWAINSLREK